MHAAFEIHNVRILCDAGPGTFEGSGPSPLHRRENVTYHKKLQDDQMGQSSERFAVKFRFSVLPRVDFPVNCPLEMAPFR